MQEFTLEEEIKLFKADYENNSKIKILESTLTDLSIEYKKRNYYVYINGYEFAVYKGTRRIGRFKHISEIIEKII
jgi:hypothetical protein